MASCIQPNYCPFDQKRYIPYGSVDVNGIVDEIALLKPDFIFSTVVGNSNIAFLNRLFEKHPNQQIPPIMSFGLTPFKSNPEEYKKFVGLFSTWSYYNSLDTPESKAFTRAYQKKYGSIAEIDDPAATSYSGVYLWAQAARDASNVEPTVIRELMLRQSIASPGGPMYIDPQNANTWSTVYIARINERGIDEVIWSSGAPIEPVVYMDFKTPAEWNLYEYQLHMKWGDI
jgi:urea transport system substrate-binding protein